ncbi:MAG: ribosome small subunit-dependent GTPase A [Clostridiales bacterium]|jgi:ribosome biogenesis GTPase|nr:ribosome small subunit-dependent GTPase A [Clostridiales bacterium]
MDNKNGLKGLILKGIGGFYYVEAANKVYSCKARGVFRKQKITPLSGDEVIISVNEAEDNTIEEILPRKNFLLRPPVANIGRLIIISSTKEPSPVLFLIDKLIAIAVNKDIEPVVAFSKSDLEDTSRYIQIYKKAGIKTLSISAVTHEGKERLTELISDKINVFTGNSGVGKSSILNILETDINQKVGEISKKLGRGRHTTREVELFKFKNGYIADTPGFSALETGKSEIIPKDVLPFCFPEFLPYLGKCKFSTCSHTNDAGCVISEAVKKGEIGISRYESYKTMYDEVKDIEEWSLSP